MINAHKPQQNVRIEYTFDAARDQVFEAWINPDYGSGWAIGEYLEIKRPEKIMLRVTMSDETGKPVDPKVLGMDPDWPQATLLTITLEDLGGKTKMIVEEDVNEDFARKTGAYPGWIQMFDRLNKIFVA